MSRRGVPVVAAAVVVVAAFGVGCAARVVTGPAPTADDAETTDANPSMRDLPVADVPDDLRYVFRRSVPGGDQSGDWEIALGSPNGDAVSILRDDRNWSHTEPKVSPDGRYLSVIGVSLASDTLGDSAIFVAEMSDLSNFERVDTGATVFTCAHWSPGAGSMVVSREAAPGEWRVSSIDIASGAITDLWDESYEDDAFPCGTLVDDNTYLYHVLDDSSGVVGVWRRDLDTSQIDQIFARVGCTTVYPIPRPGTDEIAVHSACVDRQLDGLRLASLTDGAVRHVVKGRVGASAWSPDGDWILLGSLIDPESTQGGGETDLWIVRADGSQAARLEPGDASWPSWIPTDADCSLCPETQRNDANEGG